MKRLLLVTPLLLTACSKPIPVTVSLSRNRLVADGYDQATVTVTGSKSKPEMSLAGGSHYLRLSEPVRDRNGWESTIRASLVPGPATLLVRFDGGRMISRTIAVMPQTSDFASDGTPDFLRLDEESDRTAFRRWFTFLAEAQYFNKSQERPVEITDCSALLRYAYREALHNHDSGWSSGVRLPLMPAIESIQKYAVPHTPLGPRMFRTRAGAYLPSDLSDRTFAEFADVEALSRFNTYFISRDIAMAQPGDLLFYRRASSYHSMIFVGDSQVNPERDFYVVYHTGPDGTSHTGEIRRLTVKQLLQYPDPQWQSVAANPVFLGIYRWNILKTSS